MGEEGPSSAATAVKRSAADPLWRKVAAALGMMVFGAATLIADYFFEFDVFFHALLILLTIRGLGEFYDMCETSRTGPFRAFGQSCAVMLVLLHWASIPGVLGRFGAPPWIQELAGGDLVLLGLVIAIFGAIELQATKRDNERAFESISSTLFGILYCWFLPSFLIKLRHLGADGSLGGHDWNYVGSCLLLGCLAVSKFSDVGGYLFGRKLGRHKMIPRISPNKTYEGLVAGLFVSVAVAYVLWWVRLLPVGGPWRVAVFGLLVGGMGVFGDLAESLLKRGSGKKDTGRIVPGFGGILDVVDSLLISAPVAYFLCLVLLKSRAG